MAAISEDAIATGRALAGDLFARLAEATADGPGVTRATFGAGEQCAHDLAAEAGDALGLERAVDAGGNLFLTLPGSDRRRQLLIGSHLDSVPQGGNFDGAAGVLAGLAVVMALQQDGVILPFDLTVIAIRAEESCWFPYSYLGSRMALGRLDPALLDRLARADTGRSLAAHMAEAGFDPEAVRRGETLLDPARVIGFIEPHIEQGPVLVETGQPLGIVTGIRGSRRYRTMQIEGAWDHSGATPRHLRKDAAVAAARIVSAMDEVYARAGATGRDLAVTFCQLATDPKLSSFSKVAGRLDLSLDLRSLSEHDLDWAEAALDEIIADVARRTGTTIDKGPKTSSDPALMAPGLIRLLENAAAATGLSTRLMPSGAGHDAALFAASGIDSAMLFIRNAHGSHNPAESMEMDDFGAAVRLLAAAVTALPNNQAA